MAGAGSDGVVRRVMNGPGLYGVLRVADGGVIDAGPFPPRDS